ncbi:hypothetical protein [Exiguobacterium sp. LL15]|uniref:hypothetical protein n=1 Tax=Exiguobacterium sp. LL15 TaxID=2950547 RepID=UPI00210F1EE1|nr:hypothetical protein [Exiguobacterium sp. LL15]MCQ4091250.1 hypothetical protein [Exiguobacterium sp. LL15]
MTSFIQRHAVLLIFPILDVALNLVNYAYHLLLARELSSAVYGLLNAYLAFLGLLLIIGGALQWTVTRDYSQQKTNDYQKLRFRILVVTGCFLLILLYALPYFLPFTKINLLIVYFIIVFHILLSFRRGVLQATERFYALNLSYYIESVVKVLATWLLIQQTNVSYALLFILAGMIASYLLSLIQVTFPVSSGRIHANGLVHMIHTQVVMTLFFTLDSLLVTRYFPQLAGDYSVALRFGQLLLFVALSLAQLLLPRLSQKSQDEAFLLWERRFYRILLGGLALAVLVYWTIVPYLIPILFGSGYDMATHYIKYMVFVYVGITLIQYEALVQFSLHRTGYLKGYWLILILFVLVLTTFHSTVEIWLLAQAGVFLLGALILRFTLPRHPDPVKEA